MSKLVDYTDTFKFILRKNFDLTQYLDVKSIFFVDQTRTHAPLPLQEFIKKAVKRVKETLLNTSLETCEISQEASSSSSIALLPPSPDQAANYLRFVAEGLYRCYGIEIKQVDPTLFLRKIVVTWHRDHPCFFPSYLKIVSSEVDCHFCTLKFQEKRFQFPKNILAARSAVFGRMFQSQLKESAPGPLEIDLKLEGLEETSVQMCVNYFYTGEVDLESASFSQIENLLNLADFYDLPYLQQLCFEHLCKKVDVDCFEMFITLAKQHRNKAAEASLALSVKNQINVENFENLITKACSQKMCHLEKLCLNWLAPSFKAIEEIQPDTFLLEEGHTHIYPGPQSVSGRHTVEFFESCTVKFSEVPLGCIKPCRFDRTWRQMKLLQLAVKCQSVRMVKRCAEGLKKACSFPSFSTDLSKLLDCLVVSYHYSARLEWWPQEKPNPLKELKEALLQQLKALISRENNVVLLIMAMNEKIPELQDPCLTLSIDQFQKMNQNGGLPNFGFVWKCASPLLFQAAIENLNTVFAQSNIDTFLLDPNHLLGCLDQLYFSIGWQWLPPELQAIRRKMIEKLNGEVLDQICKKQKDPLAAEWLKKAVLLYLENGNFDSIDSSSIIARTQHLTKLIDLTFFNLSIMIPQECHRHFQKIQSNPTYHTNLIALMDVLVVSHLYCNGLPQEWPLRYLMHSIQTEAIELIKPLINLENVEMFWQVATQYNVPIWTVQAACISILIPEVKKINNCRGSIWGQGDLFDCKKLFHFILQSQSIRLADAAMDYIKNGDFGNRILNYNPEDLVELDYVLEVASSNPTTEPRWLGFLALFQVFREKVAKIVAETIKLMSTICIFNQGQFVTKSLHFAQKLHLQNIKEASVTALISALKNYTATEFCDAYLYRHKEAPPPLLAFTKICLTINQTYLDNSPSLQTACEKALIEMYPEGHDGIFALARQFDLTQVLGSLTPLPS